MTDLVSIEEKRSSGFRLLLSLFLKEFFLFCCFYYICGLVIFTGAFMCIFSRLKLIGSFFFKNKNAVQERLYYSELFVFMYLYIYICMYVLSNLLIKQNQKKGRWHGFSAKLPNRLRIACWVGINCSLLSCISTLSLSLSLIFSCFWINYVIHIFLFFFCEWVESICIKTYSRATSSMVWKFMPNLIS